MAARVIPFAQNLSAKNISITATDATPEGCILQAGQDAVTFTNNAGAPVSIAFNPAGIFTPINNLPAGQTSAAQAAPTNGSVNYYVTIGAVVNGPYAVQAGLGPMFVVVSGNSGAITCTPDPVAVPAGGNLKMSPALSTDQYGIGWTNSDPFTPPIATVDSTPHAASGSPGQYPYTVTKNSPKAAGPGGGKVIVVGT